MEFSLANDLNVISTISGTGDIKVYQVGLL